MEFEYKKKEISRPKFQRTFKTKFSRKLECTYIDIVIGYIL